MPSHYKKATGMRSEGMLKRVGKAIIGTAKETPNTLKNWKYVSKRYLMGSKKKKMKGRHGSYGGSKEYARRLKEIDN